MEAKQSTKKKKKRKGKKTCLKSLQVAVSDAVLEFLDQIRSSFCQLLC